MTAHFSLFSFRIKRNYLQNQLYACNVQQVIALIFQILLFYFSTYFVSFSSNYIKNFSVPIKYYQIVETGPTNDVDLICEWFYCKKVQVVHFQKRRFFSTFTNFQMPGLQLNNGISFLSVEIAQIQYCSVLELLSISIVLFY